LNLNGYKLLFQYFLIPLDSFIPIVDMGDPDEVLLRTLSDSIVLPKKQRLELKYELMMCNLKKAHSKIYYLLNSLGLPDNYPQ